MNRETLKQYAQLGARSRLAELDAEASAIRAAFPSLSLPSQHSATAENGTPRRRTMSAAAKKAISARMKIYWTERKKKNAVVSKKPRT